MLNELQENKTSRLWKFWFVLPLEAGTMGWKVTMIKLQLEPVEQWKNPAFDFANFFFLNIVDLFGFCPALKCTK